MIHPELLQDFIQETTEHIDEVEPRLVAYLSTPANALDEKTLDAAFRLFHTLKGNAGFLQLNVLHAMAHRAEDVLDIVRRGRTPLSPTTIELVCQVLDWIRLVLAHLEQEQDDEPFAAQAAPLRRQVIAIAKGESTPTLPADGATPSPTPLEQVAAQVPPIDESLVLSLDDDPELRAEFSAEADEQIQTASEAILRATTSDQRRDALAEAFRAIHSLKGNCGFVNLRDAVILCTAIETTLSDLREGDAPLTEAAVPSILAASDALKLAIADISQGGNGNIPDLGRLVAGVTSAAEIPPDAAPQSPPPQPEPNPSTRPPAVIRQDIRVNLDKLDDLINVVGELVITESILARHPLVQQARDQQFGQTVHQLHRVIGDLQDIAMSLRMIPLAGTFRKMVRLVHDVSHRMGKNVRLELAGEDTEVDKNVIEQIADPLVHLVRNAIDHGIEPPPQRQALGKPPQGLIQLTGRHEGGEVWITLQDDGRGLDRDAIIQRAHAQGLIPHNTTDIPDAQLFRLVFEPGFSTAAEVSDISGRGVGMDVVRTNIEQLGGRVDLHSKAGAGTTVTLRLPLTLAIIDGMLVRIGANRYTIPMLSIRETFRPLPAQLTRGVNRQELVRLRDQLVPIIRLADIFNVKTSCHDLTEGIVVIVEEAGQPIGLFVDTVEGQQQAVVKGLSSYLGAARAVSGCTILGDGRVSLILDIPGILRLTRAKWQAA